MNPITIRLQEEIQNYFESSFETKTAGVKFACESFIFLRSSYLYSIKGIFSSAEIHALTDNLNGLMAEPRMMLSPNLLIAHLEDGDKLEGLSDKWNIDFKTLIDKIIILNQGQCFFLQMEIFSFWWQNLNENAKSIDEFFDWFIIKD